MKRPAYESSNLRIREIKTHGIIFVDIEYSIDKRIWPIIYLVYLDMSAERETCRKSAIDDVKWPADESSNLRIWDIKTHGIIFVDIVYINGHGQNIFGIFRQDCGSEDK